MAITRNFKDNFWNNLRVERNISCKEISHYLGYCDSYASMLFSGEIMPKDLQIQRLCDLFDVPFEQGKEEFRKAHALWHPEKKRPSCKNTTGTRIEKFVEKEPESIECAVVEPCEVDNTDIIKLLYGKLDYDLFEVVRKMIKHHSGDVLEYLYSKVSYKEFMQVWEALRNE